MVREKDEGATRRLAGRPRTPKGHEAQLAVQASQITQNGTSMSNLDVFSMRKTGDMSPSVDGRWTR